MLVWNIKERILTISGVRRFPLKETNSYSELRGGGFACKHPPSFKLMQDVCVLLVLYRVAPRIPRPLEKACCASRECGWVRN